MTRRFSFSFSTFFLLSLFFQRPSALGNNYTFLGLMMLLGLTFLYVVRNGSSFNLRESRDLICLLLLIAIYLVYESLIALIFGNNNLDFWLKELIITVTVCSCFAIFLSNKSNNHRFFYRLVSIVSLLGWSSFITLIMASFFGLGSLRLMAFTIEGYENYGGEAAIGNIYFPLSMTYGGMRDFDAFSLYRFNGFFRESGIYQAIASYSLILSFLQRRSVWIYAGLIVGVVCTFSTIGVAMLPLAVAIIWTMKKHFSFMGIVVGGVVIAAALYTSYYMPYIGLKAKSDNVGSRVSVTDRHTATVQGLKSVYDNPLGYGPTSSTEKNAGITLVASLGAIGVPGFILLFLISFGLYGRPSRYVLYRVGLCAPLAITALAAQPIAGSPIVYVLVMVLPPLTDLH